MACARFRLIRLAFVSCILAAGGSSRGQESGAPALAVEGPTSLAPVANRVQSLDLSVLAAALSRIGLSLPSPLHVTLVEDASPLARATPPWVVGFASGPDNIAIFPERIGSFPYDSLESVVWHEVTHLALEARAGGRPLPRWFHEGVAMSVDKGWGVGSRLQLLLAAGGNPGLTELERLFNSETRPDTARAYLLAAALLADLRQRHGPAVPGAIAHRVAQGVTFDVAFAAQTGDIPAGAAARAWRFYGRWAQWIPVLVSASSLWTAILGLAFVAFAVLLRKRRRRRRQWDEEDWGTGPTVH